MTLSCSRDEAAKTVSLGWWKTVEISSAFKIAWDVMVDVRRLIHIRMDKPK